MNAQEAVSVLRQGKQVWLGNTWLFSYDAAHKEIVMDCGDGCCYDTLSEEDFLLFYRTDNFTRG